MNLNIQERFGRLVVLAHDHDHYTPGGKKKPMVSCQCDCGSSTVASLYDIRSGRTRSCGCLAVERTRQRSTRHSAAAQGAHTPEYKAWRNMITRGRNPNTWSAKHYVLRGIMVCEEWLPGGDGKGFDRFFAHVGRKPSPKHSLDRIDNDGSYHPGNVRWATQSEQVRNRSRRV